MAKQIINEHFDLASLNSKLEKRQKRPRIDRLSDSTGYVHQTIDQIHPEDIALAKRHPSTNSVQNSLQRP